MRDEALWRQIEAAPLLSVEELRLTGTWRLFSKPLAPQVKAEIILEFKRFLYLLAVSKDQLMASPYVASALTSYLARPEDLARPDQIQVTALTQAKLSLTAIRAPLFRAPAYRRTLDLRASEFGPDDPEHIWPGPLSLGLQLVGWGCLAFGFGLTVLLRLGAGNPAVAFLFLALGGFFWGTEGPWPSNLPIRKSFMAQLVP